MFYGSNFYAYRKLIPQKSVTCMQMTYPIIYNSKTADGSTFFVRNEFTRKCAEMLFERPPLPLRDIKCTLIRMHQLCMKLRSAD